MKPTEDRGRPSRLKVYLYLLTLHHPPLASFLANRGQNFLSVPDANLGDLCYWRRLEGLGAMARYAVIAGYVRRLAPGGSVLDVGCAHGILARDIAPFIARYLGIDRDEASVEAAAQLGIRTAAFATADAHSYVPATRFDAIVFNESFQYLRNPLYTLRCYMDYLTLNGVIIVSIAAVRPALQLVHMTQNVGKLIDKTLVLNGLGIWSIPLRGGTRSLQPELRNLPTLRFPAVRARQNPSDADGSCDPAQANTRGSFGRRATPF